MVLSRENLKLAAVAAICLTVGLAGPSVAGAIQKGLNADQVDGKHAVGAKAPVAKRKNKLVATNKQGYLPDNIVQGQSALRTVSVPGFAIGTTEPQDFQGAFLPDGQSDSVNVRATVPPSYRAGSPVTLDLTYVHGGGPCTISVLTLGDVFSPSRKLVGGLVWALPNNASGGNLSIPGPAGNLRIRLSEQEINPLKAGDIIALRLSRHGNDVNDVCGQSVYILGATFRF